ncbi:MAG TPA: glycosyltransferase family 87 protein [Acidobacteriaceae bacterium]
MYVFACTFLLVFQAVLDSRQIGQHDFIEYWSSGRLALQHKNPYDSHAIAALEGPANPLLGTRALIMGNPPWTLPLLVPFARPPLFAGFVLWFCLSGISLFWSVRMIGRLNNKQASMLDLLGYTFAPALVCLATGQMTILLLVGVVGFFLFHRTRPVLAGACLWLCLLKPHLFLPFACVLVLWIISRKRYSVLGGIFGAGLLTSVAAMWFDPHVWGHYFAMMRTERLDLIQLPCLSIVLRQAFAPHVPWIQWVPVCAGSIWAVYFFITRKEDWNWIQHGPVLILVSMVVAPYTWLTDQTIALPALLYAVYRTRSRVAIGVLALGNAAVELALFNKQSPLFSRVAGLSSLFWLAWYLVTVRHRTIDNELPARDCADLAGPNS